MSAPTRFRGPIIVGPKGPNAANNYGTPMLIQFIHVSDPTQAAGTGTGWYLPANCIVIDVWNNGGVTGSSANIVIGLGSDDNALADDLPATYASWAKFEAAGGAELDQLQTSELEVTCGAGSTPPSGGDLFLYVMYIQRQTANETVTV